MARTRFVNWLFLAKSVVLVLLLLAGSNGFSQPPGYSAVKDLNTFKKEFARQSAQVLTISSDFKQEKQLIALTEKITSTGKFWFKRSNKVRIDYEKPFMYRLVMNGDRILVKDDQKENRVNVKSNKVFQQINRIMLDCIQGTILDSQDFSTRVFENERTFLLSMTPSGKSLKGFFSGIILIVDKGNYSVNQIEMNEAGGDTTILSFHNKVLNQLVDDEVFSL
jgi:outer membrane lipoprotein-sorting protein